MRNAATPATATRSTPAAPLPAAELARLRSHVADILLNWDYRHLELEFRIGLKAPTFVSSVGRARFEALRRSLGDTLGEATVARSVHEIFAARDGVLRRETPVTPGGDATWVHKQRLANFDSRLVDAWHVRASSSLERAESHAEPGHPPDFVRRRDRWSHRRGPWSIDLTVATGNAPSDLDNDDASYEVEVELVDRDEFFRTPLEEIIAQGMRLARQLAQQLGA